MEYRPIMGATQHPDLYDGETCDQERSQWHGWAEGDKGDGDNSEILSLAACTFPPGTKVEISVPECPKCTEPFDCGFNPETGKIERDHKCQCGFDWDAWVAGEFS